MKIRLPSEKERFKFYYDQLQSYEGVIELKKIRKKRTIRQNSYLHVLINMYAIEYGDRLEEAKQDLKRECSFMNYVKNGKIYYKSSADLDTLGLHNWIEWIKDYAGQNGLYLPSADDYQRNWIEIERTIESNKNYLQ